MTCSGDNDAAIVSLCLYLPHMPHMPHTQIGFLCAFFAWFSLYIDKCPTCPTRPTLISAIFVQTFAPPAFFVFSPKLNFLMWGSGATGAGKRIILSPV